MNVHNRIAGDSGQAPGSGGRGAAKHGNVMDKFQEPAALMALPSSSFDVMLSFVGYSLLASGIFFVTFAMVRYYVNKNKNNRHSSSHKSHRHKKSTKHKYKTNKATKIKDIEETEEEERKILAKDRKRRATKRKHKDRKYHSTSRPHKHKLKLKKHKIDKTMTIDEDKSSKELFYNDESRSYETSRSKTTKRHRHKPHHKYTKVHRPTVEDETSSERETFSTTTPKEKKEKEEEEEGWNSSNDIARPLSTRTRTKTKNNERGTDSRKNNKSIVVINRMNEIQSSVPPTIPLPSICFDEECEGRSATVYQSDKCRRSYKQLKTLDPVGAVATAVTTRMSKGDTNSKRFKAILLSSLGGRRTNNNIITSSVNQTTKPKSKGDNRSLSESIFKYNLLKGKSIEQLSDTRGDIDEVQEEEKELKETKPNNTLDDRLGSNRLPDCVAHSEQIYKRGESIRCAIGGGPRAEQKKRRKHKVTFSQNLAKAF